VSVQKCSLGLHHAKVNNDVSLGFNSAKDLTGQVASNAIRLH
jgi:hypothetical protein